MTANSSLPINPFAPAQLGSLRLRSRLLRAGCFEGLSQGGQVSEALIEHHRRLAEGGIAMTTLAYCSISYDGRAFGHELWMRPEIGPGLRRLTDAVHREGAAASIQLGHCGFFSNPREIGARPLGASAQFCLFRLSVCRAMSEAQIEEKTEQFVQAARQAQEAGFDAIEIHAGHGYLLSQFLSPWTNHRRDSYGGPLENRMRFPVEVLRRVRRQVGPDFPILIKMNQRDGMRGGLELDEALQVARRFEQEGATALVPSAGFTAKTPLYMMRGNVPTLEMARNQKDPLLRLGLILFGWLMVQRYPFAPLYQRDGARRFLAAVKIPVIYIGGLLSRAQLDQTLADGFAFAAVGRATVRDPDFPKKLASGETTASDCDHCNRCIAATDAGGVYCVSSEKGLLHR